MKTFARAAALIFLFLAFAFPSAGRTNFVIIVADDSTPSDYGCYGNRVAKTPNIDSLARNGMLFTRAFVTASSCSPSRTSMLTGVYPSQLGLARNLHVDLPESSGLTTLQKELSEAGYHTGIAGKTHIGKYALSHFDDVRQFRAKAKDAEKLGGNGDFVSIIKERPKDRPFFFWLASTDPHRPFTAPDYAKAYPADSLEIPEFWEDTPETREDLRQHYGEIARLDHYVGRVLSELEAQGVLENTLVLYIADNGRPFPRYKTTNYDTGTKVPFIAMWGGALAKGSVSGSLVSTVDIAPTLLDMAEVKIPKQFEGRSFLKVLKNPLAETREAVFTERNWHGYKGYERAVRDKKYSYVKNWLPALATIPPADIVDSDTFKSMLAARAAGTLRGGAMHSFLLPRPPEELYDLEKDPLETRNLADLPEYARIREKYARMLEVWMASIGESFDAGELLEDWNDRDTYEMNELRRRRILVPRKDWPADVGRQ